MAFIKKPIRNQRTVLKHKIIINTLKRKQLTVLDSSNYRLSINNLIFKIKGVE